MLTILVEWPNCVVFAPTAYEDDELGMYAMMSVNNMEQADCLPEFVWAAIERAAHLVSIPSPGQGISKQEWVKQEFIKHSGCKLDDSGFISFY